MKEAKPTVWEQGRQAAAYYGLAVAVLWILSFALTMGGLNYPILRPLGFLVGIMSVYRCGILVRSFRIATPKATLSVAYRLVWLTFMLAALLTTMAQYIYFRWMDNGLLAASYRTLLTTSQVGISVDDAEMVVEMMESMTPTQWTMNMMFCNVVIGTLLAPFALFFARKPHKKHRK